MVIPIWLCPSISCTTLGCTPILRSIVAELCLRSWKRISGSPAFFNSALNCTNRILDECRCPPIVLQKMRSVVGFWPWILVVLGIAAILGSLNGLWALRPVARPSIIVDQYYSAIRNHDYAQAYRFLDASLTSTITQKQFAQMAQEQDAAYGPVSSYVIAPDLVTTPLPGEPLPLVTFASNPAENVTVTVMRAHGPSYMVHIQGRQVGKAWKITAFYRI
jgi:hypothetical protein